jgi:addiction module RelE/StbE family toxin
MYELNLSKLFDNDIDSAYQYIRDNLESPMAAENLMKEVKQKLNCLKNNPMVRPLINDKIILALKLRAVKVKNYVIYYNVDKKMKIINLVRFLHHKRDWINIINDKKI